MAAGITSVRPVGRSQRWAGADLPPARWTGVGVERRSAIPIAEIVRSWRRSAGSAALPLAQFAETWRRSADAATQVLASPDGRWALVSTSVTALIAGSVAWLAAGLTPGPQGYSIARDRMLMPYQLFLKLAGHGNGQFSYGG